MAISVEADVEALRDAVRQALTTLNVVGAAVAVVQDDKVLLCDGFGLRDAASTVPVDEETLFAIGSSTKAFTTMSVAILADRGKIDWDAPVRRYMPDFALQDPVTSAEVTARDMGSHRVGLPRHDTSWYKSAVDRAELVRRVRYLEANRPLRTTFQYQNLMFTTLGYLVERVSGKTWEAFTAERILAPLGMRRTNFSVHASKEDPNHAKPYDLKDGENVEVPFADIDAIGPAGSINSCAQDMAQWLRLHLGDGEVDGARVISGTSLEAMHLPQIVLPDTGKDERRRAPAYGLGWFTEVYQGVNVVHHGGNIDGFTAMVMLVPERRLGVAVLCNQSISVLPAAVAYTVVDRLSGLPQRDWPAYLDAERQKMLGVAKQGGDYSAERVSGTTPSHALNAYAGEYEHPAYGTLGVTRTPEGLQARYHALTGAIPLEHYHYDVFVARAELETLPMTWRIHFHTALDGTIDGLEIQLEPLAAPIVFRKKAASVDLSSESLQRYVGRYLIAGIQKVRVELTGDGLAAVIESQPARQLLAQGQHRFALKDLPGFAVQFDVDAAGACVGGKVIQPNGIFPLTVDVEG